MIIIVLGQSHFIRVNTVLYLFYIIAFGDSKDIIVIQNTVGVPVYVHEIATVEILCV